MASKFKVLRGKTQHLSSQTVADGNVLFTPDSGQLYFDVVDTIGGTAYNKRIPVSGQPQTKYISGTINANAQNGAIQLGYTSDEVTHKLFNYELKPSQTCTFAQLSQFIFADLSIGEGITNGAVTITVNGTRPTTNIPVVLVVQEVK